MSKFETVIKESVSSGRGNFIGEVSTIEEATKDAKHALIELNQDKAEQAGLAEYVVEDTLKQATKRMADTANVYRKTFNDMVNLQVSIIDSSKTLTQKSKDYAGQVGDALARIDKVLVKDFEVKLNLLERFVIASKEMAELEKSGALQRIALSFK